MEQEVIILYAEVFNRPNDNGGNVNGVSIWYYPAADLNKQRNKETKTYGLIPCKAVLPVVKEQQLRYGVPGVYKMRFINVPSGASGIQVKLTDVIFQKNFEGQTLEDVLDEE